MTDLKTEETSKENMIRLDRWFNSLSLRLSCVREKYDLDTAVLTLEFEVASFLYPKENTVFKRSVRAKPAWFGTPPNKNEYLFSILRDVLVGRLSPRLRPTSHGAKSFNSDLLPVSALSVSFGILFSRLASNG